MKGRWWSEVRSQSRHPIIQGTQRALTVYRFLRF